MIAIIGNYIAGVLGGFNPSAELQAWMDQITTDGGVLPDLITQEAIDRLLSTPLSTGTVYSRMKTGYFYHFGNSLTWRRNIKNPAVYRTTISGTLFSSQWGVKSNGTSTHIEQPFKTDEYVGIESDLTCAQYVGDISGQVNSAAAGHGYRTRSDVVSGFYNKPINLTAIGAVDNQSATVTNYANINHHGLFIHRNDGTSSIMWNNGIKTTAALVPVAPNISNNRIVLGRNNRGSTGAATITDRYPYYLAFDFLFDGFNDTDAALFKAAVDTYTQEVGLDMTTTEFNTLFDQLNLQSDDAANFTIVSNAVSQWNDLSPSARHATQGTAANRPAYASGIVTFDGSNDALTLASEVDLSAFTLLLLLQKPNATVSGIPIGSSSRLDFLQMTATVREASVFKAAGGFRPQKYGSEEFFTVLVIRMNGSAVDSRANDRTLLALSNTLTSGSFRIGKLGSSSTGSLPFAGVIRAACVSSTYLTDSQLTLAVNKLLSKYPYPAGTDTFITALGDSITQGNIPGGLTPWLQTLGATQTRGFANLGISGTMFTNYTGQLNNGYDRFEAQMVTKPYKNKLLIFMGTNDIAAGITATNFGIQYSDAVIRLLAKGYSSRDIVLIGLPRRLGDAQSATVQAYNTQISTISTTNNCRYVDLYTAFTNGGGDTLMSDEVHPNQSGHDLIATTVDTAMQGA